MSTYSPQLRQLVRRCVALAHAFLPGASPVGHYSQDEYDRVAAFRLLVHAELEWYLEEVCRGIADGACSNWRADGKARTTILALLAFAHEQEPPATATQGVSLVAAVEKARNRFCKTRIPNNDGIQQKNVLSLLLPVGIREDELEVGTLAHLDAFGVARGDLAHRSAHALQTAPDPVDAKRDVVAILLELRPIDARLMELANE